MPQPRPAQASNALPAPPSEPVQEGARWRWHRPSSEAVAEWFSSVPLDEEMPHSDYIGGVVLIPGSEKVKHQTERGQVERYEMVYTPYVQIGTRVAYFHRLAAKRDLISVIEAMEVPRSTNPESPYFNGNMATGLWWHIVEGDRGPGRFLCATARVALYEREAWLACKEGDARPLPVLEATGTKQVGGGFDPNGIAKAQTGAIGRALGVAGVLVIGTGIATAEDMLELESGDSGRAAPAPSLPSVPTEIAPGEPPAPSSPKEQLDQLRSRAQALAVQMQEQDPPDAWREFQGWWQERQRVEGWKSLEDVPVDPLAGIVARMQALASSAPEADA